VYAAGDDSGGRTPHHNQVTLATDYLLSKRTDLFLTGIYQRASGPGACAQIYTTTASSSHSPTLVQAGIRHRF
jgi:predicted porin